MNKIHYVIIIFQKNGQHKDRYGSNKCQGVITRKRVTKNRTEQSVIDILLFSSDLSKHFVSMHIDKDKKHVLTRCTKTKKGVRVKESDHNVSITEFNCYINADNCTEKIEVYNLKIRSVKQSLKSIQMKQKFCPVQLMKKVILIR